MAIKNAKKYSQAIKKRRSKTIVGSLFRGAGNVLNASAYNWIGDKLDNLILGDQNRDDTDDQSRMEQNFQQSTGVLRKKVDSLQTNMSAMYKIIDGIRKILSSLSQDISFIKERVSVTFFQVKDLSGEVKDVMYDPMGPAGGQFRRATEKGTLTSKLPKELEEKVISKVASYTLKQYKEQQEKQMEIIEYKIDRITADTDPTKFKDPLEDLGAVDPLERLRREMNEGFEKVFKMLEECCGKGGGGMSLLDLLGLKNVKILKNLLKWLGKAGLVGLAGFIAYEMTGWLNETLGLSEKINDALEYTKDFIKGETEAEADKRKELTNRELYTIYENAALKGTPYKRLEDGGYVNTETGEFYPFAKNIPDEKVRNILEYSKGVIREKIRKSDTNQRTKGYLDDEELANALEQARKDTTDPDTARNIKADTKKELMEDSEVGEVLREKRAYLPEVDKNAYLDYLDERYEITGDFPTREEIESDLIRYREDPVNFKKTRLDEIKAEKKNADEEFAKREALRAVGIEDWKTVPLEQFIFEETEQKVKKGDGTYTQKNVRAKARKNPEDLTDDKIKDFIYDIESRNNYDAVFGDASGKTQEFSPGYQGGTKLTDMTLQEVKNYQESAKGRTNGSSRAVGKGQFMHDTLFGEGGTLENYNRDNPDNKIEMTDKFTPEVQDKLLDQLYKDNERGLKRKNIETTPENRYMAHYIGVGGLEKVLQEAERNPNSKMTIEDIWKAPPPVGLGKTEAQAAKAAENNPNFKLTVPEFLKYYKDKADDNLGTEMQEIQRTNDQNNNQQQRNPYLEQDSEFNDLLYGEGNRNRPNITPPPPPPPPPPGPDSSPQARNSGGGGDDKQVNNFIDNRRNSFFDNGNGMQNSDIADPRSRDTSFGKANMRQENLPWSRGYA